MIEINGMQHFYPYTLKPHQFSNFKISMLKRNSRVWRDGANMTHYNVLNLNTPMLEGLKRNPEKLTNLLTKAIANYSGKNAEKEEGGQEE